VPFKLLERKLLKKLSTVHNPDFGNQRMEVEVRLPEKFNGVMSWVMYPAVGGKIMGDGHGRKFPSIKDKIPQVRIISYSTTIRSLMWTRIHSERFSK
jgi:translation elongation factor EF-G